MPFTKRSFLKLSGVAAGAVLLGEGCSTAAPARSAPPALDRITRDVAPITVEERTARIAKAQRLMGDYGIDALLIEPGSAMLYFSGIDWWRSERLTALVIPQRGDIGVVTPHFEEPSVRESLTFGDDVRTWNEDENPLVYVAAIVRDRGVENGRIGIEDTVRNFVVEGLRRVEPDWQMIAGTPVTQGCRMYKSEAELRLLRKAAEVTLSAYRHVFANLRVGMTSAELVDLMNRSQTALGGAEPWALVLIGPASAYPHGTREPSAVRDGAIVLMDCGCAVQGYQSDISRTLVHGKASARQREVWKTVRTGQKIAFETAQPGTPAGRVDDAVRAYYESLGYGPGYATPGLSHRTGHGIGMDGHESVNFVHGETTPLAPGMCFSNEPGIYIFGEFGVRLEDCIHITDTGPAWFTMPPDDVDDPLGRLA